MIQFEGVSKRFPGAPRPALYPLDLEVPDGTILGLVGRNGAGKSTLLRLAVGLLRPSSGRVRIDGADLSEDPSEARRALGWVPEAPRYDPQETPAGLLAHLADLDGRSPGVARRLALEALAHVELADGAGRPIRILSQGQLRRLSIAAAWLERPKRLLYDEATNGLDLAGRRILERSLSELRASGGSAILSTHRLDEVEAWCDRIAILDAGRLVATVAGGESAAGVPRRLRVVVDRPPEERLAELAALGRLTTEDRRIVLEASVAGERDLVSDLVARGFHVREVQSIRADVAQYLGAEEA